MASVLDQLRQQAGVSAAPSLTFPSAEKLEGPAANLPPPPSNPLEFVAGQFGNLVKDVPEIINGITQLIGVAGHDVAGLAARAWPGEQAIEKDIEQNGFMIPALARQLPGAIVQDYASRYGFHGPEEFITQLYNNPLSYILDFFMFSSALAKGTELAARAGMVSENAAMRVLGVSRGQMELGRALLRAGEDPSKLIRPAREVIDVMGSGGGKVILETSKSPLKRFIQNKIIDRVLTRSADEALRLFQEGTPEAYKRLGIGTPDTVAPGRVRQVESTLEYAASQGYRVLRPQVAQSAKFPFTAPKMAQRLFGIAAADFYDARNVALRELGEVLERLKTRVKDLGLPGEEINKRLVQMLEQREGWASLFDAPNDAPPVIDTGGLLELDDTSVAGVVGVYRPQGGAPGRAVPALGDPDVHEALVSVYGKAVHHNERVTPHSFNTPESDLPGQMSYDLEVGSLDQAAGEVPKIEQAIGARFIGFRNYFGEDLWWKGLHGFFQRPDGSIVEINFTTPMLREAQDAASHVLRNARLLHTVVSEEKKVLMRLAPDDPEAQVVARETAAKIEGLSRETRAAEEYARSLFRAPVRAMNHPDGYDPFVQAIDELFLWEYKYGARPFVDDYLSMHPKWWAEGINGPYTETMNRAFAPMRLALYHDVMVEVNKDLQEVLKYLVQERIARKGAPNALTREEEAGFIRRLLVNKWQVPEDVMDEVLDSLFPMNVKKGAQVLRSRLYDAWYERAVVNGEGPWSWETMRPMVPQLPSYYPHIPVSKVKRSALLANIPPSSIHSLKAGTPKYSRGWRGVTARQGAILEDPAKAYAMVATEYLRHKEMVDAIEKISSMGRLVSFEELQAWHASKWGDTEVLFSPTAFKRKIMLHSLLQHKILSKMDFDGKDFWSAAEESLLELNDKILKGVVEDLKGAPVYAIPKHVAQQATRTYFRFFAPGTMRVFFDGPMNLWRASVLGLNPRWLIFNEMGNILFAGIGNPAALRRMFGTLGRHNAEYLRQVMEAVHASESKYGEASIRRLIERGFFTTEESKLRMHWGSAEDLYPRLTRWADSIIDSRLNPLSKITRKVRSLGTRIEQQARLGAALDEAARIRVDGVRRLFESNVEIARRLAREGLSPYAQDTMLKSANRLFGDYTSLSPLERDVVRRFFVPFYPFFRHVVKFTLRMPWDHPLKSQVLREIEQMDSEMQQVLPEYLSGAVLLGQLAGKDAYLNLSNINPLRQLSTGQALSVFHPLVQAGVEGLTGVSDLGIPFEDPMVYESGTGMKFKWNGRTWEPFEGTIHPDWWKLLLSKFGTPINFLNLEGYKNPTTLTRALGILGIPINRFDTGRYLQNLYEGQLQAQTYGPRQLYGG